MEQLSQIVKGAFGKTADLCIKEIQKETDKMNKEGYELTIVSPQGRLDSLLGPSQVILVFTKK